jgi:predicted nucleic acid-binding protein
MMAAYFFDTSALINRHVRETGTAWVRTLTQPRASHTIYLASITAVEVCSAITRRQRGGSLSAAQAGAILGHFRRHLSTRYIVRDLTPPILSDATILARKHGLRAYDAVQLATAMVVDRRHRAQGAGPFTLVSADRELNAAAAAEGLSVDDPNSHP